ncbi:MULTISPECIES: hypothetical protein [Reichenbachiella]|uniref:hypothetical protein n=1 Tax=Reichenbachiella TaxID=156993 RepID=UPI000E6B5FB5|nr:MULTISPECIES: hypothetical protein [Reichenbachiella]MBU2913553.1 hypothetical protein [Reichenbachiella agariperforans]RJE74482.1 hypothetical protein BGP76_15120 [Reichenbachiella sp. MSK19-1]
MKDKLEDFIREQRDEFDDLEPSEALWRGIAGKLDGSETKSKQSDRYMWLWKVAAVVFVCLSIGLLSERYWTSGVSEEIVAVEEEPSEDIERVERYYSQLIAERRAEIIIVMKQTDIVDDQLLHDLDDLDQMYQELKMDLAQNQNNEKVINAMIRNLQLRVEILNKQLKILDQLIKYEENEAINI